MPLFTGENYYALILGASSGMGLATAQKLAQEGMNLCLVHRDRRSRTQEIEAAFTALRTHNVQVLTFNLNALQPAGRIAVINALKEKFSEEQGKIRLLLHAISRGNLKRLARPPTHQALDSALKPEILAALAQLAPPKPEGEETWLAGDDFALTIQAMATSLWDWTQAIMQSDLFAADARILGLTSEGNQRAWPYYAAVSAAKATLESLIRAMAKELAPYGLRSNVIQAGVTDTPSLRMIPGSEQLKASAALRNPFGRLTTPEDVAKVVALLCTDEAAWINGALIPVDGGERVG
ncbi:MAG: SDR family oxidoreductase [Bacteroidota bacterium]